MFEKFSINNLKMLEILEKVLFTLINDNISRKRRKILKKNLKNLLEFFAKFCFF